jgi:hypothetical protein
MIERADAVRDTVRAHLVAALGTPTARSSVTFVGVEPIDVLRFVHDGLTSYVTVGMAAAPMRDPLLAAPDPVRGPRAEILLSSTRPVDAAARALCVLAAAPAVEGLVVGAGAVLDLGEPLWPGSPFSAVLVEQAGPVPDCALPAPAEPVVFLPVVPITAAEAALKRARGVDALRAGWSEVGADPRDPDRRTAAR